MTGHCFWCVRARPLTRDHVVPKACGGDDTDNIVWACRECNEARSDIVTFGILAVAARDGKLFYRTLSRLHRRLPAVLAAQHFWRRLETEQWGSSPSGKINLTLPALPPEPAPNQPRRQKAAKRAANRVPHAVLTEARRRAEARWTTPESGFPTPAPGGRLAGLPSSARGLQ